MRYEKEGITGLYLGFFIGDVNPLGAPTYAFTKDSLRNQEIENNLVTQIKFFIIQVIVNSLSFINQLSTEIGFTLLH